MLSRSNSNAGDRLRRAKSISSAHTAASASGHSRPSINYDPATSRQHAEAAALEAYERARQHDELARLTGRLQLNRRRSQVSGKSEGSHFEEARRRSQVRRANSIRPVVSHTPVPPQFQALVSEPRQEDSIEETIITRKRSVIPPMPATDFPQHEQPSSAPSHSRRRLSEYTEGSPAPRYSQCVKDRNSALQALTSGKGAAESSDFAHHERAGTAGQPPTHVPPRPARPTVHGNGISADDKRLATERSLEEKAQKRLRERKSFFGTFQKRRATANGFDMTLPPFNYASDSDAAPLPRNPARTATGIVASQKSRHFSNSLRGRLKQVFRKTSKPIPGLPPQQVQATDFHFTVRDYDHSEGTNDSLVDLGDPFMTVAAEEPRLAHATSTARPSSKTSTIFRDSAKSRVTSWTNSTLAAVSSIRTNKGPFADDSEPSVLHHSESHQNLRKRSSFFGNPVRNKLRRASKAELKGSEESIGLYSALQKRIRSARSSEPVRQQSVSPHRVAASVSTTNALKTLPSQQHKTASPSARQRLLSTIRAITPDAYKVDVPSPVHEVASPVGSVDVDDTVVHNTLFGSPEDSPSGLHRRSAIKAASSSPDALARRMERAKSRWQTPLDEQLSRSSQLNNDHDGLPSFGQAMSQSTPTNGLPHHAKNGSKNRLNVISPSVYSRATDGASPRPLSPEVEDGTMITITGREVRTYSISPRMPPRNAHHRGYGSGSWRKWLSDEMNSSLGNNETQFQFPHAFYGPTDQRSASRSDRPGHKRSMPSIAADLRPRSISPLSDDGKEGTYRPRSRASSAVSVMESRYPMIAPSRRSSQRSTAALQLSRPASPEERILHSAAAIRKPNIESTWHSAAASRLHTSSRVRASPVYELEDNSRCQSALDDVRPKQPSMAELEGDVPGTGHLSLPASNSPLARVAKAVNRPRSAYELRAKFKNSVTGKARPIEVRRKPAENTTQHEYKSSNVSISMIDDSTIINIAAGPYASPSERPPSANHENMRPPSANIENTRPQCGQLPALSSSEWLATGSIQNRPHARNSALADSMIKPSISRLSARHESKRSPGQRLVTNWLDEKKSKENFTVSKESTPAFV